MHSSPDLLLRLLRTLACLVAFALVPCLPSHAQDARPDAAPADATPGAGSALSSAVDDTQVLARLRDLRVRIADREADLKALRTELRRLPAGANDPDLQKRIADTTAQLQALRRDFEQLAIDGLDMSVFTREVPKAYDWQAEMLEVVKPIIGSLKELTDKPRRIEAMRRDIERAADQLQAVDKAVESIDDLLEENPVAPVADALKALKAEWEGRRSEILADRELYRVQLARLEEQAEFGWNLVLDPVWDFVAGRGLTLAYALAVAVAIWLFTRILLSLALRISRRRKIRHNPRSRERAARYLYRGLTILLITIGVIVVFYLRSDMLLLALAIVLLIMSVAALRQAVPRYISEIRLLLGFGSVREGERIDLGGVPMRVVSINAYAIFANPELSGYHRVPLGRLHDMHSRPVIDEPWFPSRTGDFLLLPDDRFVEVVGQSVEQVKLRFKGSELLMSAADFIAANPLNLSREGFIVVVTFGVDYALQPIALDQVPSRMEKALDEALSTCEQAEHRRSLLVAFSSASAHSLDYLVVVGFDGAAAGAYFGLGRLVQQTLVRVCNEEGWSIPFEQLTVHLPQAPGSGVMPPN